MLRHSYPTPTCSVLGDYVSYVSNISGAGMLMSDGRTKKGEHDVH